MYECRLTPTQKTSVQYSISYGVSILELASHRPGKLRPVRIEGATTLAKHEFAQPSQDKQGEPVGILKAPDFNCEVFQDCHLNSVKKLNLSTHLYKKPLPICLDKLALKVNDFIHLLFDNTHKFYVRKNVGPSFGGNISPVNLANQNTLLLYY